MRVLVGGGRVLVSLGAVLVSGSRMLLGFAMPAVVMVVSGEPMVVGGGLMMRSGSVVMLARRMLGLGHLESPSLGFPPAGRDRPGHAEPAPQISQKLMRLPEKTHPQKC